MMIAALFLLVAGASALPPFLRVPVGSLFGPSGYLTPDGQNVQFTHEQADNIAVAGPSGVVTKDGRNIQFYVPRTKRSAQGGWIVGPSAAIGPNGELVQFKTGNAYIVSDGPSGTIFSDGTLVQKRAKRSAPTGNLIGASGIITKNGRQIQLEPGVTVVVEGHSGIVLSNGKNIQLA